MRGKRCVNSPFCQPEDKGPLGTLLGGLALLCPGAAIKNHISSAAHDLKLFFGRGALIIIIEGLSLLQSIPPTTANKQTQAHKKRGSMARKLLGANPKSYRLKLKLN